MPARATRDAMDRLLENMQAELARAEPIEKAAILERVLRVQGALLVDLRNRVRKLEEGG